MIQLRKRTGEYQPSNKAIQHVEAVLDFLRVFADDERYEQIKENIIARQKEGGQVTMCTFAEEMTQRGLEQGLEQGLDKGLKALVTTLKQYVNDFTGVYQEVIKNEEYAGVTEEAVRRYF